MAHLLHCKGGSRRYSWGDGQLPLLHCGAVCWGGVREGTMPLAFSALAPLFNKISCKTRSFSCLCNPYSILQLEVLSLSFPIQPVLPCLHNLPPCLEGPLCPSYGLDKCFFNSLVVGLPCSLAFWHFWLFIVFKLVVILLLVVQGSKALLPMPPSWLELSRMFLLVNRASSFSTSSPCYYYIPPQKDYKSQLSTSTNLLAV